MVSGRVIHNLATDDTSLCVYEEALPARSRSAYRFGLSAIDDRPADSVLVAARVLADDGHVARVVTSVVRVSEREGFTGAALLSSGGLCVEPSEHRVRYAARVPHSLEEELVKAQSMGYECDAELHDARVLASATMTARRLRTPLDVVAPMRAVLRRWMQRRRVQARVHLQEAFRDACVVEEPVRLAELALEECLRRMGLCAVDCKGWVQCRSF